MIATVNSDQLEAIATEILATLRRCHGLVLIGQLEAMPHELELFTEPNIAETWAIAESSCGNFSQAASLCERSVEASTPATPVGVQRQRQLFQAGQPYIDFQLPQRKSQRLELTPQ